MTIVASRIVHRSLLLAGAATMVLASPALAQDAAAPEDAEAAEGNVIIVSATKRDTTIQDVPFSINAQTQEDIQRSGAVTLEDLSRNVAGLTIQNLGPGQSQVSVRGISAGQVVRDQPGVKEQVGVYLDESVISLSLFTPDIDLFDLNRVETLRGPQGTLFGSGSVGGTIRYITNQPEIGVTEGSAEANLNVIDGGNVGGHLKAAINVPLGENVAARVVGYYTRYAGFIDAQGPGGGENVLQVSMRVAAFLAEMQRAGHAEALVICHAGTMRLLQAMSGGGTLREAALRAASTPHQIGYGEVMVLEI